MKLALTVVLLLVLTDCSAKQTPSNTTPESQTGSASQARQPLPAAKPLADLQVGEASGSIVDEGQEITLKYAYARHGETFGGNNIEVLLTEAPMPEELAKRFQQSRTIFQKDIRGLEYKLAKDLFWVMYHPSGYQTSEINRTTDYSVENGIIRGHDEDSANFNGKDYKRSVSFVARVQDKKK